MLGHFRLSPRVAPLGLLLGCSFFDVDLYTHLYILNIYPLSITSFAKIFFHSVHCLFILLRYVPSVDTLMKVFYHEWILSFAEAFSAAIKVIVLFLSFLVLRWCITVIDLHLLNQLCDPG